jgi:hypothetical protein
MEGEGFACENRDGVAQARAKSATHRDGYLDFMGLIRFLILLDHAAAKKFPAGQLDS